MTKHCIALPHTIPRMSGSTDREVYEQIKTEFRCNYAYDIMLHDSLSDFIRERSLTSGQIEELVHLDESGIKSILVHKEPRLGKLFSNKLLGELSLLWLAVVCQFKTSIELLVRSGADVNELFGSHKHQMIDKKWTIIHALLQLTRWNPLLNNERLIRLITNRGANLQARNYEGQTVLHFAVIVDRVELTKWLLKKGAEVNVVDKYGMTPLLHAAKSSKADKLLPPLMEHGADVTVKNNGARNVLHCLALNSEVKYTEVVRALIEKVAPLHAQTDSNGYQPMHWAIRWRNFELVKLLYDHGVHLNAQTTCSQSLLHIAIKFHTDDIQMLRALLKRGADVDLRTIEGFTALHYACIYFNEESIKLILSVGANVLAENKNGKTPFALISYLDRKDYAGPRCMLKALALIKVRQPSIELKDEKIIQEHPELWDYYQNCITYVSRMKFTRLVRRCTFLDLLYKSHIWLAELMRNPNFEANIKLYDRSGFDMYNYDIVRAFKRAQNHYRYMLEQQNTLDEATYDILPYTVVREIVSYCEFPCCEQIYVVNQY